MIKLSFKWTVLSLVLILGIGVWGCAESAASNDSFEDAGTDSETSDDTVTDSELPTSFCTETTPLTTATSCATAGILIQAPWSEHYKCFNLGPIPDVPSEWGGMTLHPQDNNILLIGGNSNEETGKLYSVGITRDKDCHITGFSGSQTTVYSSAEYNDGGIAFGPSGVLFLARWPVNQLGQLLPGSTVEDKIINLGPLNVTSSPGGLGFVPQHFAGAGNLKTVSWPSGDWFTLTLAPDGLGTFDVVDIVRNTTIPGGPEGFVYISKSNYGFSTDSLLVAEWSDDNIAAYEADDSGDPIPETRKDFILGLEGAEGAFIDPQSGDFLFITWGGADVVIAVRGFRPPVV